MTKRHGISKRLRFHVLKRDSFMCRYCGDRGDGVRLQIDHIIPVARGGTNEFGNLITACFDCNAGKTDEPLGDVLPPWRPLPPKPAYTPPSRGRVFRLGQTARQALRGDDLSFDEARAVVMAEIEAATESEDEFGNEIEPSEYLERTIWRPANNPHSFQAYEPHAVFTYDDRSDEPLRVVYADALERAARQLFDQLPHHEGWIYWRGGCDPLPSYVSPFADCEFLFRNGSRDASTYYIEQPWAHLAPQGWDGGGDIIAYRIRKKAPRASAWKPKFQTIEGRL